jgi:tetratricopeptide (TPR) repeat protein
MNDSSQPTLSLEQIERIRKSRAKRKKVTVNKTKKTVSFSQQVWSNFINAYVRATNIYDDSLNTLNRQELSERDNKSEKELLRESLTFFQSELPNIKIAINKASEIKDWSSVIDICDSLKTFYYVRTYWEDFEDTLLKSLNAAEQNNNTVAVATSYNNLGRIFRLRGKIQEGIDYALKSFEIFSNMSDRLNKAQSSFTLGFLYRNAAKWDDSIKYLKDALEFFTDGENFLLERIEALNTLGLVYKEKENCDLEKAEQLLEESQRLQEKYRINDQFLLSKTLSIFGKICIAQGKYTKAKELYERSLEIKENLKDNQGLGVCHNDLGQLCRFLKQFDEAEKHYNASLDYKRKCSSDNHSNASDNHGEGITYMELGLLYRDKEESETAILHWNNAKDKLNNESKEFQLVKHLLEKAE